MATRGKEKSWKDKNNTEEDYQAETLTGGMEQLGVSENSGKVLAIIRALWASGHEEDMLVKVRRG